MATMTGGDHPSGKKEGSPIVTTTTDNDSPISSLEDIAANAEQTIISIGDSIVTSLSEGFEILARSSEEVIFPYRQAEEQRMDEQHEQMRIMQQKAEEDYKAAKQSLKQKKEEEQEGQHDDDDDKNKLSVLKKVSSFGKVPSFGPRVSSFGSRVASFGRNNRSSSSQKQQQPSSSSPQRQPSSNQLAPIYVKPPSQPPVLQQPIIEPVVQQPVYVQETVTDNWKPTKMKKKRSLPRLKLFNR